MTTLRQIGEGELRVASGYETVATLSVSRIELTACGIDFVVPAGRDGAPLIEAGPVEAAYVEADTGEQALLILAVREAGDPLPVFMDVRAPVVTTPNPVEFAAAIVGALGLPPERVTWTVPQDEWNNWQPQTAGSQVEFTEKAREAVNAVETAVAGDGWIVAADIRKGNVHISLEHPLSTPHALNFPNDDASHLRFINEALSQREFATIARRPKTVEHPKLLQSFRAAATANSWSPAILETVAAALEANGLLTEDESLWLQQAGHTWDGPQ